MFYYAYILCKNCLNVSQFVGYPLVKLLQNLHDKNKQFILCE